MKLSVVDALKQNGFEAISELYLSHRSEFLNWSVHQFNCDIDDARDAYQQAVVLFYENVAADKIRELTSSPKTYLFAIAKNKILEKMRAKGRVVPLDPDYEVPEEDTAEPIDESSFAKLREGFAHLGEPCAGLLKEFYYHRKTMAQLMETFGYKSEASVKNQKYKCLQRLKRIYFGTVND